jgi:uncharacterized RDD family membrane protein YckC
VEFDDRMVILTPEGVDLELALAGLGSRLAAVLIDIAIQAVVLIAAVFALGWAGDLGSAALAIVIFAVFFGYNVLFEVSASGRTPGKQASHLRVLRVGGAPVGLLASATRNIVRLVDFLPFLYLVGSVSILVTPRNQRLGDLAAGTIVVREHGLKGSAPWQSVAASVTELPEWLVGWDVSQITPSELATVRSFLERRDGLSFDARSRICDQLVRHLRPKVGGAPMGIAGEPFLEALATVKASRL